MRLVSQTFPAPQRPLAMRQTGLWSVYRLWSRIASRLPGYTLSMRRTLALLLVLFAPAAAFAQEVPPEAERDLWCGTAFELLVANQPADASAEKLAAARPYEEGARELIQRALPIYLEAGYSDAALAAYRQKLEAGVSRVVNGGGWNDRDQSPSFEDCKALIGQ